MPIAGNSLVISDVVYFWSKVDKSSNCWIWTASKTNGRYGQFYAQGKRCLTHRYSWLIHNGDIPKGLCVCHTCDNPPCVNPKHLWLGTNADNMRDKIKKGRLRVGIGERNGKSKLVTKQINSIRALYLKGYVQTVLAKKYDVCQQTISHIVTRKFWKHV